MKCVYLSLIPSPQNAATDLLTIFLKFLDMHGLQMCQSIPVGDVKGS